MIGALLATFVYQQLGFLPVTWIAVLFNVFALLALGIATVHTALRRPDVGAADLLLDADDRIRDLEVKLFGALRRDVAEQMPRLQATAAQQAQSEVRGHEAAQSLWWYGLLLMVVSLAAEGLLGRRLG